MNPFKTSSEEKKKIIKEYLSRGFKPIEIAKALGISRQLARYWMNLVKEGK